MNIGTKRFALRSTRVCTPDGEVAATLVIHGEQIEAVLPYDANPSPIGGESCPCRDFADWVIMPGIIDAHVHVNEPGRTEWEGFESATKAAIAGGITTVVDMPLNSDPVTTTVAALSEKRIASDNKRWCDVGFYGGLVPGNEDQLQPMMEAGVLGIKAFLCDSGLADFPAIHEQDLRAALPILKKFQLPLLVHAERTDEAATKMTNVRSYAEYVATRPDRWETSAIEMLIGLCEAYDTPIHIVHLSSASNLRRIAAAKQRGLRLTVETCPHYLSFATEKIAEGDTRFKCAPPIRSEANRRLLVEAVVGGRGDRPRPEIDTIGSDHSPCPPALKCIESGDFRTAWGGIAALQLTLPAVWTAARGQDISMERVTDLLSAGPARLLQLQNRKGSLRAGLDADLCVWDPNQQWTVQADQLFHRHSITPYEGLSLFGMVKETYLRGQLVNPSQPPRGVEVNRSRFARRGTPKN